MKKISLTESEARTVVGVFSELEKMPYSKLNCIIGSMQIADMKDLYRTLRKLLGMEDECSEEWMARREAWMED